jgi:hypothetical protein
MEPEGEQLSVATRAMKQNLQERTLQYRCHACVTFLSTRVSWHTCDKAPSSVRSKRAML